MHARHFMKSLWNCIQFWLSSVITVSLLQSITSMTMLPPMFSAGQILWICCFVVPLIAMSLVHSHTNPQVMLRPVSKNYSTINSDVAVFVAWCYGLKFLPSLLIVPVVFGISLASHCTVVATKFNSSCSLIYPIPSQPWGGWEDHYYPLTNAQMFTTTLLVLHLVTVSVSFVHREFLSWRRSPFRNKIWLMISGILLILQCLYALISVSLSEEDYSLMVPWIAIIIAVISPFLIFLVNEFVKWQEIKTNLRSEKRARLDFGTKLGMNSPF